MKHFVAEAQSFQQELVCWRRHFHQNPELGMDLPQTSAFVFEQLEKMGCQPKYVAKTGVTATLGGKKPGKCILLRADMDALPVKEEADVEFRSNNDNMHACEIGIAHV